MNDDILQHIQQLQFTDRTTAEALLLTFLQDRFPFEVASVELRPQAISLNSFNGFVQLVDGRNLFFKTHTESDTVISEYYNATMLAEAGYRVIQPMFQSNQTGEQLLVYERITAPSVFDLAWDIENDRSSQLEALTQAQNTADDELLQLYKVTLTLQTASQAKESPIHQLFYHRLTGGRFERFYGSLPSATKQTDTIIHLPLGDLSMQKVRSYRWIINGQEYSETINDLVQAASELLYPAQDGMSIIGHGDAHNGNVFFQPPSLTYFDPAFAGRHSPLLDVVKPIFHNVFAMWMYFPNIKEKHTLIEVEIRNDTLNVHYDYALHPVRRMFLDSKFNRVLIPILQKLQAGGQLRSDWRRYIKLALMCCPLLTMNLTDVNKFPPSISLLGLAMTIEMGSESSIQHSLIDSYFNQAETALT